MLVVEVLKKYHQTVPFPLTPRKIKKANLDPARYLMEIGYELAQCEDIETESSKAVINALKELSML